MKNCETKHRTHRTLAKCIYRYAAWVHGAGPYASLAYCNVLTVQLYRELEDALAAKRVIDHSACGGKCHGDHRVVYLDLDAHRIRRADIPWEEYKR